MLSRAKHSYKRVEVWCRRDTSRQLLCRVMNTESHRFEKVREKGHMCLMNSFREQGTCTHMTFDLSTF